MLQEMTKKLGMILYFFCFVFCFISFVFFVLLSTNEAMCNTLFLFYCRQRHFFTKLEWTPRTSKTAKLTSRKQNVDMKTYTRGQDK